MVCAMAAKKKPASAADFRKKEEADKTASKKSPSSGPTYKGQKVDWKTPTAGKATEAITQKGQKATGLSKPKSNDRFSSNAKTPVYKDISGLTMRGSGTPLNSSFGINPMNKKQIMNAAASAAGIGAVAKGASAFTFGTRTVVSEGTKKLQRELSKTLKDRSQKGMSNLERQGEGEYLAEMDPTAKAEWRDIPNQLRKDISESMKKTDKTKIVIKKKK